jgi:hypothetical protein
MQRFYEGDPVPTAAWRTWTVPWAPDERIESRRDAATNQLQGLAAGDPGVFNRPHGSPYYATKIPDLQILRYSRYLDATGTHRLRGPKTQLGMRRSSQAPIRWTSDLIAS